MAALEHKFSVRANSISVALPLEEKQESLSSAGSEHSGFTIRISDECHPKGGGNGHRILQLHREGEEKREEKQKRAARWMTSGLTAEEDHSQSSIPKDYSSLKLQYGGRVQDDCSGATRARHAQ